MNKEIKKKILVCLIGTVFTLSFCFFTGSKSILTGGDLQEGIALPIIMYENISDKEQFEEDLDFLREKGYNSVLVKDLKFYQQGVKNLPENPIILSFDGGYKSFLDIAYPVLEKYNMKAVVSIVGENTDFFSQSLENNSDEKYLSWEDVKALAKLDIIEIGNQSYSFYDEKKGVNLKYKNFSDYKKFLIDDVMKMQEKCSENIYKEPILFTYPYGFYNKESEKILKEVGFDATFTFEEGMNFINKDKESLFELKRFKRDKNISAKDFFGKIKGE